MCISVYREPCGLTLPCSQCSHSSRRLFSCERWDFRKLPVCNVVRKPNGKALNTSAVVWMPGNTPLPAPRLHLKWNTRVSSAFKFFSCLTCRLVGFHIVKDPRPCLFTPSFINKPAGLMGPVQAGSPLSSKAETGNEVCICWQHKFHLCPEM